MIEKPSVKSITGSALTLLPLLTAAVAVQPYPLLFAACLALLWIPMERAGLRVTGLLFIFLQDVALRHGQAPALIASALCVVLMGALLLLRGKIRLRAPEALYPGLALGAAVMMALYQCGGYFAVGAAGAGMRELLRSYGNLGFHPNWRTVLFSTIMMVVLITWPRKFKRLSKVLPSGFVGIVIVTLLNFLLNPMATRSTVAEFSLCLPWLPFFGRLPISALSMLLIFVAWEEVPWGRVKAILKAHRPLGLVLLFALPAAMFWFDLLWVAVGAGVVWVVYRYTPRPKATLRSRLGTPLWQKGA